MRLWLKENKELRAEIEQKIREVAKGSADEMVVGEEE
jgi:hypothetical protein